MLTPEATITREVRTALVRVLAPAGVMRRTVNSGVVLGLHGNRTDHLSTARQSARYAHIAA